MSQDRPSRYSHEVYENFDAMIRRESKKWDKLIVDDMEDTVKEEFEEIGKELERVLKDLGEHLSAATVLTAKGIYAGLGGGGAGAEIASAGGLLSGGGGLGSLGGLGGAVGGALPEDMKGCCLMV
jgi:hypothetical protein